MSDKRISELVVETGAYKDLDEPVILTGGELGIYYINTEKLVQDGGEWKKYGEDSKAMIEHAIRMTKEHPTFGEVIDIITERAIELLKEVPGGARLISGGQRRDWLFSGPVAARLEVPHLSLYKQEKDLPDKMELVIGEFVFPVSSLADYTNLPIADLVTEGSSQYRLEEGVAKGWIPMAQSKGAMIKYAMAIVDRLQGAKKMLADLGIVLDSFVDIDDDFINRLSKFPERGIEYRKSPSEWSKRYLAENGALALLGTFEPAKGEQKRCRLFMQRYGDYLKEIGRFRELDDAAQLRYGMPLEQILRGEQK